MNLSIMIGMSLQLPLGLVENIPRPCEKQMAFDYAVIVSTLIAIGLSNPKQHIRIISARILRG